MRSRWSPADRLALVDQLAARTGADSESFFLAHNLGTAYQKAGRGNSKKAKIASALQAAERRGDIDEVLDHARQYLANESTSSTERKPGTVTKRPTMSVGQQIFISHASVDKPLADLLRNTLILGGVPEKTIFYSSDRATGIPAGNDVREHLRKILRECNFVVELISLEFLRRPICLMELGGAWALNKPTFPIIIPPLGRQKAIKQLGEVHMGNLGDESDIDGLFDELSARLLQDVGHEVKAASWNRAVRDFKAHFPARLPLPGRASSTVRRQS